VGGEKQVQARCRFCETWEPVDSEHFFPFRAIDGAHHVNARCRKCEANYRAGVREATKAGTHEVKPRPRHHDEAEAEAATAQKSAPKPKSHASGNTAKKAKAAAKPETPKVEAES
jgi:hypothetical protein